MDPTMHTTARLKEGSLKVKSFFGRWKKGWFAITNDGKLLQFKTAESQKPQHSHRLGSYKVADYRSILNKENCIALNKKNKETRILQTNTEPEFWAWLELLQRFSNSGSSPILDLENFSLGAVSSDKLGVILGVNQQACRLFGFTEEELIGQNVTIFIPPVIASIHDQLINRYLRTGDRRLIGASRVLSGLRKDKTEVRLHFSLGEYLEDGQLRFVATFRQITDATDSSDSDGEGNSDDTTSPPTTLLLDHEEATIPIDGDEEEPLSPRSKSHLEKIRFFSKERRGSKTSDLSEPKEKKNKGSNSGSDTSQRSVIKKTPSSEIIDTNHIISNEADVLAMMKRTRQRLDRAAQQEARMVESVYKQMAEQWKQLDAKNAQFRKAYDKFQADQLAFEQRKKTLEEAEGKKHSRSTSVNDLQGMRLDRNSSDGSLSPAAPNASTSTSSSSSSSSSLFSASNQKIGFHSASSSIAHLPTVGTPFSMMVKPNVIISERISSGGSSLVVFTCLVDGWVCAMKELQLDRNVLEYQVKQFEHEISVLESIPSHPNVCRYLFHDFTNTSIRLFMTKYTCTLQNVITERKEANKPFSVPELRQMLLDVVQGLRHLHRNGIVHRDLKSDNLFCILNERSEVHSVVLGDFDQVKSLRSNLVTCVGTPGYIAPEVLQSTGTVPYDQTCDLWSLGMVIYELLTLNRPYYDVPILKISTMTIRGTRPSLPETLPAEYKPFIKIFTNCTNAQSSDRPKLRSIREKLMDL